MEPNNTRTVPDNKKFFEQMNTRYEPLSSEQRRNLKRQRKVEKRERKAQSQRHMDKFSLKVISPLTANQTHAFEAFKQGKHLLLHGYAGTGKTYISIALALENIFDDKGSLYEKIVVVRSVVPTRDMGYLPGNVLEKTKAYEEPYEEICNDLFGDNHTGYRILKDRQLFEFTTTSFLRGVTFNDSIIIVDEIQNMSFQELDTVMTRMGKNCRILFCGDFRQTDLDKHSDKSGLHDFMKILERLKDFTYVEFGKDDIVRSALVKEYIIARTDQEDRKKTTEVSITRMFDPNTSNWFKKPNETLCGPPTIWDPGHLNVNQVIGLGTGAPNHLSGYSLSDGPSVTFGTMINEKV